MLALTLMVGIVIDDAIIVLEKYLTAHRGKKPCRRSRAAIKGPRKSVSPSWPPLEPAAVFLRSASWAASWAVHELFRLHFGLCRRRLPYSCLSPSRRCSAPASSKRPIGRGHIWSAQHSPRTPSSSKHLDKLYNTHAHLAMAHRGRASGCGLRGRPSLHRAPCSCTSARTSWRRTSVAVQRPHTTEGTSIAPPTPRRADRPGCPPPARCGPHPDDAATAR